MSRRRRKKREEKKKKRWREAVDQWIQRSSPKREKIYTDPEVIKIPEEWTVERSFENLVRFYADELREIEKENINVVTQQKRLVLQRHGILRVVRPGGGGTKIFLTEEAKKVLEEMKNHVG